MHLFITAWSFDVGPKFALKGPLEIHRVKRLDGEFKTQIITTSPEAFEPLTPFRQPYPPFVEE